MTSKLCARGLPVVGGLRHVRRSVVLALLFLLVPSSAAAVDRETKENAARKACLSGDVTEGVSLLSDLFIETKDLTYIFNQGRCFEQNGRYEDALYRFREYALKLKDSGQPADADVDRHIANCQTLLGKPSPTPPQATTAPRTEQPSVLASAAPEPAATGSTLRIAGIATAAIGVAGAITGVVLNLKANTLADEIGASSASYSRAKVSTRSSYVTWGWVSYGVGAACIAGGAALFFVGHSQGRRRGVALVPTVSPGHAGVALQGAFR